MTLTQAEEGSTRRDRPTHQVVRRTTYEVVRGQEPASPNQNGKVERFHGTLGPGFFDEHGPFESVEAAQQALDAWVETYNADRPHQALGERRPVVPADRFVAATDRALPLWLPPTIIPASTDHDHHRGEHGDDHEGVASARPSTGAVVVAPAVEWTGGPVELEAVVPPSGNMSVAGRQFWLGPARAGLTVRFWAGLHVIHLSIADARVKSVTSHLTVADLARLVATHHAVPAGPAPIPSRANVAEGGAVEVDRVISAAATFALGGKILTASTLLAGGRSESGSSPP